jgi:hypothetical protein
VHPAIVFGTVTFDDHELATELAAGPYLETVGRVDVSVTSVTHIHIGDWNGNGSPDLYNHANITQTLSFSRPINLLGFDVVDEDGGFGLNALLDPNNEFFIYAGGEFNVAALGFFDVPTSGIGIWEGITSFSWTQAGGEITIDNLQFSAVPLPSALLLLGLPVAGLLRSRRALA